MCASRLKLNADKTELLWVGSKHSLSQQDGCLPVLQLSSDSTVARDHVRLLGVTLSSDLSFDRHVSIVSASSFYWLRQLQRSRRSLDTESAATLVVSYIRSSRRALTTATQSWRVRRKRRLTNCNECWTPQPVWSAVPISSTEACHDSSIPSYIGWMFLSELCTSSASWCSTACTVKRLHAVPRGIVPTSLRCRITATSSISCVPHHQLSSHGRRAFCVAGPSVWNFLPDSLRNPIIGGNSFRQSLKTFLFATYWCIQRIRGLTTMRYINRLYTYLLTLLSQRSPHDASCHWTFC